jgi:hypothetical protein
MKAATKNIGEERDDEDLVVEDAVEHGAHSPEHRIEGGDDRDRQVGQEPDGDVGLHEHPDQDADGEAECRDHEPSFWGWA